MSVEQEKTSAKKIIRNYSFVSVHNLKDRSRKPFLVLGPLIQLLQTKEDFDLRGFTGDSILVMKTVGSCDEEVAPNLRGQL